MRFLILILLVIMPTLSHAQFPTLGILYNFNTDFNPLNGNGGWNTNTITSSTTSLGCAATSGYGTRAGSPTEGCYLTATYGPDIEIYATLPNVDSHTDGNTTRLFFCLHNGPGTGTVDGYILGVRAQSAATDYVVLAKMDAGNIASATEISPQTNQEFANGNKVGVAYYSNGDMDVYVDVGSGWTLLFSDNDTSYNCTNTHVGFYTASTSHRFDDLGGGTVVAPPPAGGMGSGFLMSR